MSNKQNSPRGDRYKIGILVHPGWVSYHDWYDEDMYVDMVEGEKLDFLYCSVPLMEEKNKIEWYIKLLPELLNIVSGVEVKGIFREFVHNITEDMHKYLTKRLKNMCSKIPLAKEITEELRNKDEKLLNFFKKNIIFHSDDNLSRPKFQKMLKTLEVEEKRYKGSVILSYDEHLQFTVSNIKKLIETMKKDDVLDESDFVLYGEWYNECVTEVGNVFKELGLSYTLSKNRSVYNFASRYQDDMSEDDKKLFSNYGKKCLVVYTKE